MVCVRVTGHSGHWEWGDAPRARRSGGPVWRQLGPVAAGVLARGQLPAGTQVLQGILFQTINSPPINLLNRGVKGFF